MSDLTPDHPTPQPSDEDYAGLGFGTTVFERLLLAIINGNPTNSEKTPKQRLNAAIQLLIGQKASTNPMPDSRDDRALVFMGQELHCDKCNHDMHLIKHYRNPSPPPAPKVRSDLALAELAAERFFEHPNQQARHSTVNRLREQFSGTYQRKLGHSQNINYRATYEFRAAEHDYIEETLEADGLKRLCHELAEWGIKTKL